MIREIDRSTIHSLLGVIMYILNQLNVVCKLDIIDTDERVLLDSLIDYTKQLYTRTDEVPF